MQPINDNPSPLDRAYSLALDAWRRWPADNAVMARQAFVLEGLAHDLTLQLLRDYPGGQDAIRNSIAKLLVETRPT